MPSWIYQSRRPAEKTNNRGENSLTGIQLNTSGRDSQPEVTTSYIPGTGQSIEVVGNGPVSVNMKGEFTVDPGDSGFSFSVKSN